MARRRKPAWDQSFQPAGVRLMPKARELAGIVMCEIFQFPKIYQRLPKISENFGRLPKISRRLPKINKDFNDNFKIEATISEDKQRFQ